MTFNPNSKMSISEAIDTYFNPADFYEDELTHWTDLWNDYLSAYENLSSIVKKIVLLPNADIVIPIVTTYLMQPTRAAKCIPILASIGQPGTGKSTLSFLAAQLRGIKNTFTANDTFASVRNAIEQMRYYLPEVKQYEREGAIVCWDNLSIKTLTSDPKVYTMLLVGYNIRSAVISIADKDGKNINFNTFCPKILSSVEPLHTYEDFAELHRRLWVIPHKRLDSFTEQEKLNSRCNIDAFFESKIDLESITWKGIECNFFSFWDEENSRSYVQYRSYLARYAKKVLNIPEILRGSVWEMCIDPIATGLCIGTWESYEDAIDCLAKYYEYMGIAKEGSSAAVHLFLKDYIHSEIAPLERANQQCINIGEQPKFAIALSPAKLRNYLEMLAKEGRIGDTPTPKKINEWMMHLGWQLTTEGWQKI